MSEQTEVKIPGLPEGFAEMSLQEMAQWVRYSAIITAAGAAAVRDWAGRGEFGHSAARFATKAEELSALSGPWMTPPDG